MTYNDQAVHQMSAWYSLYKNFIMNTLTISH